MFSKSNFISSMETIFHEKKPFFFLFYNGHVDGNKVIPAKKCFGWISQAQGEYEAQLPLILLLP